MTTTKRTDQLRPGDVVRRFGTPDRTVASVEISAIPGLLRVRYVPISVSSAYGGTAEAGDPWQVVEPTALDLAIQRAQELADYYDTASERPVHSEQAQHLRVLLDLFRDAR
jgi:hypothetical protein